MLNLLNIATSVNLAPIQPGGLPQAGADPSAIQTILSITFGILGAFAFLMIVIAGLRYMVAAGDPQKTAQARNTIVFALVGLAIAISAQVIVAFVVKRV
jgi:hypothetical protein